jgi:hypothetical protein
MGQGRVSIRGYQRKAGRGVNMAKKIARLLKQENALHYNESATIV